MTPLGTFGDAICSETPQNSPGIAQMAHSHDTRDLSPFSLLYHISMFFTLTRDRGNRHFQTQEIREIYVENRSLFMLWRVPVLESAPRDQDIPYLSHKQSQSSSVRPGTHLCFGLERGYASSIMAMICNGLKSL